MFPTTASKFFQQQKNYFQGDLIWWSLILKSDAQPTEVTRHVLVRGIFKLAYIVYASSDFMNLKMIQLESIEHNYFWILKSQDLQAMPD